MPRTARPGARRPATLRRGLLVVALALTGLAAAPAGTGHASHWPSIDRIEPASGPPAGGGTVTIHGGTFHPEFSYVVWNGVEISPDGGDETKLLVTVPPHAVGEVDVQVLVGEHVSEPATYTYEEVPAAETDPETEPGPEPTPEPKIPDESAPEPGPATPVPVVDAPPGTDPATPTEEPAQPAQPPLPEQPEDPRGDEPVPPLPERPELAQTGPASVATVGVLGIGFVLLGLWLVGARRSVSRARDRIRS